MSEPIKYSYRGFGSFILTIILIILGIISFFLFLLGIIAIIFSIVPVIFPDFLTSFRIMFLNERITDPNTSFILFFITGIILILVAIITYGGMKYLYRAAQVIDKDWSRTIDLNVPSIKKIFTIKSKAVIILIIMLFGTFIVIMQILMLP